MTSDHLVPSEMQFWSSLTQYAPQIPFLEVFFGGMVTFSTSDQKFFNKPSLTGLAGPDTPGPVCLSKF